MPVGKKLDDEVLGSVIVSSTESVRPRLLHSVVQVLKEWLYFRFSPSHKRSSAVVEQMLVVRATTLQAATATLPQTDERPAARQLEAEATPAEMSEAVVRLKASIDRLAELGGQIELVGINQSGVVLFLDRSWLGPLRQVRALFESASDAADALGITEAELDGYLTGQEIPIAVQRLVTGILAATEQLRLFLDPSAIQEWLLGTNAHLYDRRPVDVIREGKLPDVMYAIEGARVGAYA